MKNETLKATLKHLRGKRSFREKTIHALRRLLRETGQDERVMPLIIRCSVLAAAGFAAGLLLRNPAAAPFLAALFFLIPIWRLRMYAIRYDRHIASQLESALSLITSSYIRSNNLESAVSENLSFLDPLLRDVFEEFLTEYGVNANVESCIESMRGKIRNQVFSEWCTGLIKSCRNGALKEELIQSAAKLSAIRIVQENLNTEKSEVLSQYIVMLILLAGTLPLIRLVNSDWFLYFFTHPLGKFSVAFAVFALLYGIQSIIRCSAPVSFDI